MENSFFNISSFSPVLLSERSFFGNGIDSPRFPSPCRVQEESFAGRSLQFGADRRSNVSFSALSRDQSVFERATPLVVQEPTVRLVQDEEFTLAELSDSPLPRPCYATSNK